MTPKEAGGKGVSNPSRAMPMLRCRFGALDYLVPLSRVIEVVRYLRPTPVPDAAPWVKGVVNLRGRVHPVLDLAVKFGEKPTEPDERTCLVLVQGAPEHSGAPIGLIAGRVAAINDLRRGDLDPPRDLPTRIRSAFLEGSFKTPDGVTLVLNLDRALSARALLTEPVWPAPPDPTAAP